MTNLYKSLITAALPEALSSMRIQSTIGLTKALSDMQRFNTTFLSEIFDSMRSESITGFKQAALVMQKFNTTALAETFANMKSESIAALVKATSDMQHMAPVLTEVLSGMQNTFANLSSLKVMSVMQNNFVTALSYSLENFKNLAPSLISSLGNEFLTMTNQVIFNIKKLPKTKLERLFNKVNMKPETITSEDFGKKIAQVKEELIAEIKKSKKSISFEGILSIILSIFFFIYTLFSDIEDKKIASQRFDYSKSQLEIIIENQKNIYELLEKQYKQNAYSPVFYIVKRHVNLRLKPTGKSMKIAVLFPNQKVELEKTKGKWIYIVYYDYLDQQTYSGWVLKKYLVKMDKSKKHNN